MNAVDFVLSPTMDHFSIAEKVLLPDRVEVKGASIYPFPVELKLPDYLVGFGSVFSLVIGTWNTHHVTLRPV